MHVSLWGEVLYRTNCDRPRQNVPLVGKIVFRLGVISSVCSFVRKLLAIAHVLSEIELQLYAGSDK